MSKKEVTVSSAGVSITNGVAKFHASGETGAKPGYTKLPVAMPGNGVGWSGTFAFVAFPTPVTKLEAARHLLTLKAFQDQLAQACLNEVIANRTPTVKAPKAPKAPKVKKTVVSKTSILKEITKPDLSRHITGKPDMTKHVAGLEKLRALKASAAA